MRTTFTLAACTALALVSVGCGGPVPSVEDESALAAEADAVLGPPPAVVIVSDAEPTGTAAFAVPDMHCNFSCGPKVQTALAALDGVTKIETIVGDDAAERTAVVWTTDAFDPAAAIAAIEEVGFTATERPEDYEPPVEPEADEGPAGGSHEGSGSEGEAA